MSDRESVQSESEIASDRETPVRGESQTTESSARTEHPRAQTTEGVNSENGNTARGGRVEVRQKAGPDVFAKGTEEQPEIGRAESVGGQTSERHEAGEDREPDAKHKKSKKGMLLGLTTGSVLLLIVVGLVAAFVWPGFAGPGSPDTKASESTAALASKNPAQLEQVSCHGPDGNPTAQIPPQAMEVIQSAKSAGPTQLVLDTEVHAPVDLTLGAKGQTQTLPSIAVLGVTDHQWCLKGIAQRQ